MSIVIQMIGTGSAFAKRYFNNNAIVTVNGYRLLIDCGITAPYALHQLGTALPDLDGILITHIHGDHVGGLEEIAFRMKFIHQDKLTLFVPSTIERTLWESTLKGGMDEGDGHIELSHYFDVTTLNANEPTQVHEGFTLELIPTEHIPGKPSYAVLLNETVFYSSDMIFAPDLLNDLTTSGRCKHILHDCQLTGHGQVHTTLQELLTLPESMQERIWLMHYGDDRDRFIGKTGRMRFLEQQQSYTFD
ncbi:MBL fold metallo-hydrolase [Paenibacillus sp. TRM 82003]|nr:MBL fold metallo-hydrolase [Paenibacillus sp. TRM 82003]